MEIDSLLSKGHFVVVAPPGYGKTYVMALLAGLAREKGLPKPVYVRGDRVTGRYGARTSLVSLAAACSGPLLIDGFDEIPDEVRKDAAREIASVQKMLPHTPIVVASRPVPELDVLTSFERLTLEPLSTLQVAWWVDRSIGSTHEGRSLSAAEVERFVCHMTEREALRELFRHPLFLESACTLFARSAVTPFAEAEVVRTFVSRVLDTWDRDKPVRAREPWASPQTVRHALAEVCFHLVINRSVEFATSQAQAWIADRLPGVPLERLLPVVSLQSGFVHQSAPGRWQIAGTQLRDYFAAWLLVQSADRSMFRAPRWDSSAALRDVVRLACGISYDATSLLEELLLSTKTPNAARSVLIAETLAQPLVAKEEVVRQSCDATVAWLEAATKGWQIERGPALGKSDKGTLWYLSASCSKRGKVDPDLQRVLQAVHQARSGRAREPLRQGLVRTKSPVLVAFGKAMTVEGRLDVKTGEQDSHGTLRASVLTPQLF